MTTRVDRTPGHGHHPTVAESNLAQVQAWDGGEGRHWARFADQYDAALRAYDGPLLRAAAISPSDRVLDVGCGTGRTTREAARTASSGSALGVDLSARMLEVARYRAEAEGLRNAAFLQADAQVHPFGPDAFDVVVSRTGTMFFGDMPAAFGNLAAALRPGGRLVQLVWQAPARNEWFGEIRTAFAAGRDLPLPPPHHPGPFALADPDRVGALLAGAGLVDTTVAALEGPMVFGRDAAEAELLWLGQLGWMLDGLAASARAGALAALRASLVAHQSAQGIAYRSATWLVTCRRPER